MSCSNSHRHPRRQNPHAPILAILHDIELSLALHHRTLKESHRSLVSRLKSWPSATDAASFDAIGLECLVYIEKIETTMATLKDDLDRVNGDVENLVGLVRRCGFTEEKAREMVLRRMRVWRENYDGGLQVAFKDLRKTFEKRKDLLKARMVVLGRIPCVDLHVQ